MMYPCFLLKVLWFYFKISLHLVFMWLYGILEDYSPHSLTTTSGSTIQFPHIQFLHILRPLIGQLKSVLHWPEMVHMGLFLDSIFSLMTCLLTPTPISDGFKYCGFLLVLITPVDCWALFLIDCCVVAVTDSCVLYRDLCLCQISHQNCTNSCFGGAVAWFAEGISQRRD